MDATSASCNSNKRKACTVTEKERAKRLKTEPDSEKTRENGRLARSPGILVDPERLQRTVTVEELVELLHYAALGRTGSVKKPSWCRLHKQKIVKAVNVALVENVTQSDFYQHYLSLTNLRTKYSTRVTFTLSSKNLASELFSSEVTKVHRPHVSKKKGSDELHKALRCHPIITKFGTETRGLTAYLLSLDEMNKHNYPVRGRAGCEDFVSTDSNDVVTDSSPLYGLDCEMCRTEKGNELTRVSMVDSNGTCVLDELVKPQNRILNYLTRFSGVTARMLKPVQTSLSDIQTKIRTLLPRDAVIVGHSLNNDLMALKMIHPHVIDTSLLYRKEFGQRFKLKVLAETLLQKQIQMEERTGHNPTEDAVASLELAQYFIRTGPRQILELHLEELWGYTVEEEETTQHVPAPQPSIRFADLLQACGQSVAFLGKRSDIAVELSKQQWHTSDKQVLASFRAQSRCPFFSVLQFSEQISAPRLRTCANLRDMCVVFAGPFPAAFSEKEVRRLFRCCGPVYSVRLIDTSLRVHAEVEYELLEAALLALKTLNGVKVQGQFIKVQRPVNESTLDLDVTLETLMRDPLNSSLLYVVKLKPAITEHLQTSLNGHTLEPKGVQSCSAAVQVNELRARQHSCESRLTEETLLNTFSCFGPVNRIIMPSNMGKHSKHAYIKFESPESSRAALDSFQDLLNQNYLFCPALTPLHVPSWTSMATPVETVDTERNSAAEDGKKSHFPKEMGQKLKKLDQRIGKLFRCLPDGTLSVVILKAGDNIPGLCFLEVKQ